MTLPLARSLTGYDRASVAADVAVGATVGVLLVPQGMAYAMIAGLPPVYGLYAALVPSPSTPCSVPPVSSRWGPSPWSRCWSRTG